MEKSRIAVLFDAENIGRDIASIVLGQLRHRGVVQTACAIGDFSLLPTWVGLARDSGIELVMQPTLGKGKNSADIRLAIEAMDIVHRRVVDAVALVTHDRDFTPLALRLREAGLKVLGFAEREPNVAFRAACSSFELVSPVVPAPAPPPVTPPRVRSELSAKDLKRLAAITAAACAGGAIIPTALTRAIIAEAPELATRLSGNGKFLKTLVGHGIVERVGAGGELRVRRRAS